MRISYSLRASCLNAKIHKPPAFGYNNNRLRLAWFWAFSAVTISVRIRFPCTALDYARNSTSVPAASVSLLVPTFGKCRQCLPTYCQFWRFL